MAEMTYPIFVALDATALEGGSIFIGAANSDPELAPISVFWDEELTVEAAQPIRTSGGVIVRDGTPAQVYAAVNNYSLRVYDRAGVIVWYKPITGGGLPASRLSFPIPTGPASDVPGPADNTYSDLSAFKASDITRKTASLVGIPDVPDGRFNWTPGDYTGQADDLSIIKADSTALSVGAWVRQTASSLVFKAVPAQAMRRSLQDKLNEVMISIRDFGASDGSDPNHNDGPAIRAAINYAKDYARPVFLPLPVLGGAYSFSDASIEMENGVDFVGESSPYDVGGALRGVWLRKLGATPSDTTGVDAGICGNGKRHFEIRNVGVLGTSTATQAPTGEVGIYLKECSKFHLDFVRSDKSKGNGWRFETSYLGTFGQIDAYRSQAQGFRFHNSCTSLRGNLLSFGTAGHIDMVACSYMNILAACDGSDDPDRTFVGEGGKTIGAPSFLYSVVAGEQIEISGGSELSRSQLVYAEGADVILKLAVASAIADHPAWRGVRLAGTSRSNVMLQLPRGLHTLNNISSTGVAYQVDDFEKQRITIIGRGRLGSLQGPGAYWQKGIDWIGRQDIVRLDQRTMVVGAETTPFIKSDPSDVASVTLIGGKKILTIDAAAGATQAFTIPIGNRGGLFGIKVTGTYMSGADGAKIQIIDSAGAVLKTWTNSGAVFDLDEMYFVRAGAGKTVSLRILTNSTADEFRVEEFVLTLQLGQDDE